MGQAKAVLFRDASYLCCGSLLMQKQCCLLTVDLFFKWVLYSFTKL